MYFTHLTLTCTLYFSTLFVVLMFSRTVLWNQMVAFEEKENDPNRFRNRGGNLLAEERSKKKVLHSLPKVKLVVCAFLN